MDRSAMLGRVEARRRPWDLVIVGGGATGVGSALDAATRGFDVLLLEAVDFGKGTSSRSTKLVHGGLRYLRRGEVRLVREALRERGRLRANAPHVVSDLAFLIPARRWWEQPYYGLGLGLYEALASEGGFTGSRVVGRSEAIRLIPTLKPERLLGGVVYHDGQFDDARLLIDLARTAARWGATLVNAAPVTALIRDASGRVTGVEATDAETGRAIRAEATVVVNATGAFGESIRRMADPAIPPLIAPSQGIHLVFDRSFLPGEVALMVPRTDDGRVMFAIPWLGKTLVGTTDVAVDRTDPEPRATEAEAAFLLETAGRYLNRQPTRADVLSVFAGIRPLVRSEKGRRGTGALARDATIRVDAPGLVTITGGKWTTYRAMAEAVVDRASDLARLPRRPCRTADLSVLGPDPDAIAALIESDPTLAGPIDPNLETTGAEVAWSALETMARTVEDALARRSRALFLDARAAIRAAPRVAAILARALSRDRVWEAGQVEAFTRLARGYLLDPLDQPGFR